MKATEINNSNFKNQVLAEHRLVVVDFWAPWCGPCLMMAPVLDELATDAELAEFVKVTKLNTEEAENRELAINYQIRSIPNLKVFFKGEVVADIIGFRDISQLKAELSPVVEKYRDSIKAGAQGVTDSDGDSSDNDDGEDETKATRPPSYHIERFYDTDLSHASYLVSAAGKAVAIDPAREIEQYKKYLTENNLELKAVIETHPHADFVSSHLQLHNELGADIYTSRLADPKYPFLAFDDGDSFELAAGVVFKSIHTPGHSPDSITAKLVVAGEVLALFTGDTLFIGDVGRPDLREAAGAIQISREALAAELYESMRKLEQFEDDVAIYPTHGAGSLCGKNLEDAESSTIGAEKMGNPGFLLPDMKEFLNYVLMDQPEIPAYFPHSVELNRKGAAGYSQVATKFYGTKSTNTPGSEDIVVDARPKSEFAESHHKNALNIPFNEGKFAAHLGRLVPPDREFYLVLGQEKLIDVIHRIAAIGYETKIKGIIMPM